MATYYFSSSTGSNTTGDGSVDLPWASFAGMKSGTDALSAGDICLFKRGDTWTGSSAQITVNSNGSSGNRIYLDAYGTGNKPTFTGATALTTWTTVGTSTHSGGGTIYSKAGQSSSLNVVGVDATYALTKSTAAQTALPKGTFRVVSGTLYINLIDGGDPASHTMYVPTYLPSSYTGLIRTGTTRGYYLTVSNL